MTHEAIRRTGPTVYMHQFSVMRVALRTKDTNHAYLNYFLTILSLNCQTYKNATVGILGSNSKKSTKKQ